MNPKETGRELVMDVLNHLPEDAALEEIIEELTYMLIAQRGRRVNLNDMPTPAAAEQSNAETSRGFWVNFRNA